MLWTLISFRRHPQCPGQSCTHDLTSGWFDYDEQRRGTPSPVVQGMLTEMFPPKLGQVDRQTHISARTCMHIVSSASLMTIFLFKIIVGAINER